VIVETLRKILNARGRRALHVCARPLRPGARRLLAWPAAVVDPRLPARRAQPDEDNERDTAWPIDDDKLRLPELQVP